MSITMSHTATFVAIILWFSSIVTAIRRLPTDQRLDGERILSSMDPNWSTGNNHTSSSHRRLSSNVDVPIPTQPDEHLVTNLPFLSADQFSTKHWAGLLPASNEGDKYFFYWLFAPEINDSNAVQEEQVPLVIWLNGGPGCSSMDGLFLENGPLRFEQKDGNGGYHLVAAEYSWHKSPAYVLYIDQPVGTGLSFTTSRKYPTNDLEVNRDFYIFLQSFFTVHGDKFVTNQRVNRNFYFSGESHSGHYIPSMMAYILDQNEKVASSNDSIYIPLSGAAIGNGWIDPFHQYAAAHAAYGHGIVDRAQRSALDGREKQCQSDLNNKRLTSAVCFSLLDEIVAQSYGSKSQFKVSQYDIRKVESNRGSREFPPGHKVVESYLGANNAMFDAGTTNQVLETIHAAPSRAAGQMYLECTDPPYDALSHQDGLGVVNEVVKVLHHEAEGEDPIRLLFFNGVMDLICNHVGNEVLLEQLPWQYQQEWIKAQRTAWKSKAQKDDSISGYIKEYKNLLFLKGELFGYVSSWVVIILPWWPSQEQILQPMFSNGKWPYGTNGRSRCCT